MNNHYDTFLTKDILDSAHSEFITICGGFPHDTSIGTICLKKDNLYINTQQDNAQWEILGTVNSEPEVKYLKPELAICECCGAPLHGDKCEYCGSTYIWR